jgi:hypothetical protein
VGTIASAIGVFKTTMEKTCLPIDRPAYFFEILVGVQFRALERYCLRVTPGEQSERVPSSNSSMRRAAYRSSSTVPAMSGV